MKSIRSLSTLALIVALAACSREDPPLPGERLDPRDVLTGSGAAEAETARAFSAPVVANSDWTQRAGNTTHSLTNAALASLSGQIWSAKIGAGEDSRHRITADPVVAGGRVFALDAQATVTAVSTGGAVLWSTDLTPAGETRGDASGGGLATDGATVYATTGFGELVALDAASGQVRWRQSFPAAVAAAPTVANGTAYVVARDGSAWAINTENGRVRWQFGESTRHTGVTSPAAPAVDGRMAVFPFASGDLRAVLNGNGLDLWSSRVAGRRLGRAYAEIRDLTGDPVIANGVVYAGTSAGRLSAFDAGSGEQLWQANEGAMSPVQVAGGSVFTLSDDNALVRLDAATGMTVWSVDLPFYLPVRKDKKRRDIEAHYGPVLAGNRLIVASSDDKLRLFDPASGASAGELPLPEGAASAPVVAGGTLYIVTRDGELRAYR